MKNRISTVAIAAVMMTALIVSFTACTMTTTDPSDAIQEKTTLEAAKILTENGNWIDAPEGIGEQLFDLIKEVGELKSETLDVAISGSSTIETVYDYSFKLSIKTGNFFLRKQGEFTYKVGERFTRTYESGNVNERYEEEKLVVMRTFSKDVATLSEEQLQLVRDVFEPINAEVMNEAFEKVATKSEESGYLVSEIGQEELTNAFYTVFEFPLDARDHLLRGYAIDTADGTNYVFLTDSAEWAKKVDDQPNGGAVGRVCFFARSYYNAIGETLRS